ncbi:MAG: hypothetical protein A2W91_18460 [Bacteroidetes bacterium GWF2_38_335]|nr:MAG: hypothetical protein A2W91_18460 [Bacteroidetes bacterium GWF2_38_335]OFY78213.1 MAG: hypothetical protein A2281_04605 [Bacteroidetes bacterium RIFOXYA12_FULL_38_20]HBS88624.1 hypothetical protein [Bacteroidales bacterium]
MKINLKFLPLVAVTVFATFLFSCSSDKSGEQGSETQDTNQVAEGDDMMNDINKAKQVFYSLPSPIETAMLIKRAGAKYDESLLNPVSNAKNYMGNKSMALNLGVYSADLSFASLFDQTQTSIKYMSASKTLADKIGILNAIDKTIMDRLESNINQKDSIIDIISETFMNSNSFLKENGRAEIAAMILVGGWIEGLYIACKVSQTTSSADELIDRIIDQRLSLGTLISLLEQYIEESKDIASVHEELLKLKQIFDKIEVTTSKIEPVTDPVTKVTTLKSTEERAPLDPAVYKALCKQVETYRNNIVK